jgi:hypothetical protein
MIELTGQIRRAQTSVTNDSAARRRSRTPTRLHFKTPCCSKKLLPLMQGNQAVSLSIHDKGERIFSPNSAK